MYAKWVGTDGRFAFSGTDNGGVEISEADYSALFAAQQAGKVIANDGQGNPVAIDEPAPTEAELQSAAVYQKQRLLDSALQVTSIWQSELLLGSISDTDKASLTAWIAYVKAVQAVDTTKLPVTWPTQPVQ
ncbi:tail fiber assembly protein [Atlantibacter hermannii]|uniref:tail fiber assembly protein n=1 Tax=Atlantibacter hermannii TaxID=565 RepID=UPI002896CB48|nr:tail fiber assembly protein [Atlantibacter hermannii]MDW4578787.1 tail fiber assembly protein [Atlantibacter hermannii]